MATLTSGPTVVRTPVFVLVEDPDGTPTQHDISCAVRYWDQDSDVEQLDAATFCNPGGTETGATSHTLVIGLWWSEALDDQLRPLVGQELEMQAKDNAGDTKDSIMRVRIGALPLGRHEVGQLVPIDLACAVLSTPGLAVAT